MVTKKMFDFFVAGFTVTILVFGRVAFYPLAAWAQAPRKLKLAQP